MTIQEPSSITFGSKLYGEDDSGEDQVGADQGGGAAVAT